MASFDLQRQEIRAKACVASRRVSMDEIIGIFHKLKKVRIAPGAHVLNDCRTASEAECTEFVLSQVPDLLSLATYAWYQLQDEMTDSPIDRRKFEAWIGAHLDGILLDIQETQASQGPNSPKLTHLTAQRDALLRVAVVWRALPDRFLELPQPIPKARPGRA